MDDFEAAFKIFVAMLEEKQTSVEQPELAKIRAAVGPQWTSALAQVNALNFFLPVSFDDPLQKSVSSNAGEVLLAAAPVLRALLEVGKGPGLRFRRDLSEDVRQKLTEHKAAWLQKWPHPQHLSRGYPAVWPRIWAELRQRHPGRPNATPEEVEKFLQEQEVELERARRGGASDEPEG